ncbi:MAG: hypothetical protein HYV42_02420 [Candidatus Magasanikbacteria bacterium]|nr:hypothetical protein [Candidatus Magasanikbacteria bacterium]
MAEFREQKAVEALKSRLRIMQKERFEDFLSVVDNEEFTDLDKGRLRRYLYDETVEGLKIIKERFGGVITATSGRIELPPQAEEHWQVIQKSIVLGDELTGRDADTLIEQLGEDPEEAIRKSLEEFGEYKFAALINTEDVIMHLRLKSLLVNKALGRKSRAYLEREFCRALIKTLDHCNLEAPGQLYHLAGKPLPKEETGKPKPRERRASRIPAEHLTPGLAAVLAKAKQYDEILRQQFEQFPLAYPDPRLFMYEILGQKPPRQSSA